MSDTATTNTPEEASDTMSWATRKGETHSNPGGQRPNAGLAQRFSGVSGNETIAYRGQEQSES